MADQIVPAGGRLTRIVLQPLALLSTAIVALHGLVSDGAETFDHAFRYTTGDPSGYINTEPGTLSAMYTFWTGGDLSPDAGTTGLEAVSRRLGRRVQLLTSDPAADPYMIWNSIGYQLYRGTVNAVGEVVSFIPGVAGLSAINRALYPAWLEYYMTHSVAIMYSSSRIVIFLNEALEASMRTVYINIRRLGRVAAGAYGASAMGLNYVARPDRLVLRIIQGAIPTDPFQRTLRRLQ